MCRSLRPNQKARALRSAFGMFPTGVAVATALNDKGCPVGITINSFTSVSLTPPLISWCIDRRSSCYRSFATTDRFSLSLLAEGQQASAQHFAGPSSDRFSDLSYSKRIPRVEGCCAWFDCKVYNRCLMGDHLMIIGKVERYQKTDQVPLLYSRGNFARLTPAADANEVAA